MKLPWKILITDVDGVLTDGKFVYSSSGKVNKTFGPHDADAVKLFKRFGVEVIAISADIRGFPITKKRLNDMKVDVFQVSELERLEWVKEKTKGCDFAYVGDGFYDIPILDLASVSYAPKNALEVVKLSADLSLNVNGSEGVLWHIFEDFVRRIGGDSYQKLTEGKIEFTL